MVDFLFDDFLPDFAFNFGSPADLGADFAGADIIAVHWD